MKDSFYRCDGSIFKVPLFDHVVATHFSNQATLTDHLIDQMGMSSIYAKIFGGSVEDYKFGGEPKRNLVFLDIGANIGLISLYAAPACKRIVALEPAPDTYKILCAMTVGEPNIETYEIALAPTNDKVEFFLNDLNPTASSTVNTYGTRTFVAGMKLDSMLRVFQLEHIDIVKCDAEGSEGESLSLDQLEIAKDIVDSWYIETHNCPKSSWNDKLGEISKRLLACGYYHITVDGMTLYATK